MPDIDAELLRRAATLFTGRDPASFAQRWRPAICPFGPLIDWLPPDARVLDVGCGPGLFLLLAASQREDVTGLGFDANEALIVKAQRLAEDADIASRVAFSHVDVAAPWPTGPFDAVSMIDVMHHIPKEDRQQVIGAVARTLRPGGVFVYKDMRARGWQTPFNQMHDLLLARQWIQHEAIGSIEAHAAEAGLVLIERFDETRFWYGHEGRLFRRGSA